MSQQLITFEQAAKAARILRIYFVQNGAQPQAAKREIKDPNAPVSERQLAFMQKIAGELSINFDVDPSKFTKGEAGSWIDKHLPAFNQLQAAKKGSVL